MLNLLMQIVCRLLENRSFEMGETSPPVVREEFNVVTTGGHNILHEAAGWALEKISIHEMDKL